MLLSVAIAAAPIHVALAQQPAADEVTDRMKERFEKGQDYFVEKKFEAAAAEFRAAYEIKPAASLLYNEAVCYEKLRKNDTAVTLYRRYLTESANPRDRDKVEKKIAALSTNKPPPPPTQGEKEEGLRGVVLIESKPPGAKVYLDDKNTYLGETPWNGDIDGRHKIIVVAQGYKEDEETLTGTPNQVTRIVVALSQQHYLGWLEVKANIPAADVYIDGKEAGSAGRTPLATNITPGKHTIIITKEGFTEDIKEIDIVAGQPHKVDGTLDKAPIGFVRVTGSSVEGAKVKLDGKVVCEAAPCRFQTPSGDHRVTVEKKGLKTYSRKMSIPKATETSLQVKLEDKVARTDLIWKFGFAAAFLTGGIILGLQAKSVENEIRDDINAGNPPLGTDDDRFTKGKIYAFAADGLLLIGIITAGVGVISLFSEKGPPSKGLAESRDLTTEILPVRRPTIVVAPALGPNFAGVAAEVRW